MVTTNIDYNKSACCVRVIAGPMFIPRWLAVVKGTVPFRLGGYYDRLDLEDTSCNTDQLAERTCDQKEDEELRED